MDALIYEQAEEAKTSMSKGWVIGLLVAVVAAFAFYLGSRESAVEAEIAEVIGVAAVQSDWATVDAWRADWLDSLDSYTFINEALMDTLDEWSWGYVSDAEFVIIANTAFESLMTHVDYFEGTVPPEGLEEAHSAYIQAFRLYGRAVEKMASFDLDTAAALMYQAADALDDGNAALARYNG